MKRIAEQCPNVGTKTQCPKKCGNEDGYCPYQHCTHTTHNDNNLWDGSYCGKDECTGHCNVCGLAEMNELEVVRRGWWAENR